MAKGRGHFTAIQECAGSGRISAEAWTQQKAQTLEANKDGITYIAPEAVFRGAQVVAIKDPGKKSARRNPQADPYARRLGSRVNGSERVLDVSDAVLMASSVCAFC